MNNSISYIDYQAFSLSKKIDFFDSGIVDAIKYMKEAELNNFLKSIILNTSENSYVRKSAQKIFIECVFLKKIKVRQALTLLIDDWHSTSEVFLEMQRIKDLYFFYDEEQTEIEEIFNTYINDEELEIASEAYLNLGLINMQKGFTSKNKEDLLRCLNQSKNYFIEAYKIIENRIDAQFYCIIVSILNDKLSGLTGNIKKQLNDLANLLFEKEAYSFNFIDNSFELGFYRILNSLFIIEQKNPNEWLDYRNDFNLLYIQYAEINNQKIKNRLNQSTLSEAFTEILEEQFIEPYFSLNFHSQLSKIDIYLDEQEINSELYNFLVKIKTLAENQDLKKKVKTLSIQQSLTNIFPNRSPLSIGDTVRKIKDINSPFELLSAVEELGEPSIQKFMDALILACIKLQGNRLYKGNCSENDRNTYISDLLDSAGYYTKDQTLWGQSAGGKSAGEIDILIKDKKGFPYTIIEALNLKSLDTHYIIKHIDKTFNSYDTSGFEYNFILVYANINDFDSFWKKYMNFVSNHIYQYIYISIKEVNEYNYADIKIARTEHIRNSKTVFLYHIGVNL